MDYFSRDLIEYMNKNISALVSATLQAQHGLVANDVEVISLEVDGYFVKSDEKFYFLTFDNSCKTFHDFRTELLTHAKNYRDFFV